MACEHCQNGWLGNRFGQDVECVNGLLIDIDVAHEGPTDTDYPVAPCHPMWAAQQRGDDFVNDTEDRLAAWRGSMTSSPTPAVLPDARAREAIARIVCEIVVRITCPDYASEASIQGNINESWQHWIDTADRILAAVPHEKMRDEIAKIINPSAFKSSFLSAEFERLGVGVSPKIAAYRTADAVLSLFSTPPASDAATPAGAHMRCPWCKSPAVIVRSPNGPTWRAGCDKIGTCVALPYVTGETIAEAWGLWDAAAPKVASDTEPCGYCGRKPCRCDRTDLCEAPGCDNPTDRGICNACDQWVSDQVASDTGAGLREAGLRHELSDFASLMVDEVIAKVRLQLDAGEGLSVADQRLMLAQLIKERERAALQLSPSGAAGEVKSGGKLGWDEDGMCQDHYRFGCPECALPATTPGGDLLEQAARVAETTDLYEGDRLKNSDPRVTIAAAIRALSARNQTNDGGQE